jgi:pimeloyl-ACP methyl ester carboxylesterase
VLFGPAVHGDVSAGSRLFYKALFARPWGPAVWIKYFGSLFPTRKPADYTEYTAALLANLKEPGRVEALLRMALASKAASAARLAQVRAPALLVMGTKDPDFKDPAAETAWIAEQMRRGGARVETVMVPGAGHYPHIEFPDEAGAHALAFIRELAAVSDGAV